MTTPPPSNCAAGILIAALDHAPEDRGSFLITACGDDVALLVEVREMLAAHDAMPTGFLDEPAADQMATIKVNPGNRVAAGGMTLVEQPGDMIGHYKLREQIGEGGFGTVWVADQEKPVRRRVALKVIKMGMDTKEVISRFEQERQALAMMDHPNIAKVLDAGATELGRPFFVMELVRGVPITEYCDQNHLPTLERLGLFIAVCQAVQHAHQKGIIHRDIKPSNILVTLHDGVPVPKVIDFGIAKATEGRLTDATVYTQMHQFVGTPAYMSPEQAEMSGLDIDTRSDIYSLGVLLYELLTGRTPFDAKELMSRGIDAMRKTIREQEPARPSTRLATLQAEELTTTAKRRSSETAKLLHQLRGDLDWIVMKCLEKDRTRRYDTATGLAADLKRHLDNEPVLARPASTAYKLRKAFRRNKLAFTAAAAVALALILGMIGTTVGLLRAKRAETLALETRSEAEKLSNFMLDDFYAVLEPSGKFETVAKLAKQAMAYYEALPSSLRTPESQRNQAMAQARLALVTALVGDVPTATPLAEQAVTQLEQMRQRGDASESTAYALSLALRAEFLCNLGVRDMRLQAAPLRRALEVVRPLVRSDQATRRIKLEYATLLRYVSEREPYEQAISDCREALDILAGLGVAEFEDLDAAAVWADTASVRAAALFGLDRVDEAERVLREVEKIAEGVIERRPDHLAVKVLPAWVAGLRATIAVIRFRDADAMQGFQDSRQALAEYVRFNPSDLNGWNLVAWMDYCRAALLYRTGRVTEALELARAAARIDEKYGNAGWNGDGPWVAIARWEAQRSNRTAAAEARREGKRTLEAHAERLKMSEEILNFHREPARHDERREMLASGEAAAVLDLARESLALMEKGLKGEDHPELVGIFTNMKRQALADMTLAALKLGRFAEAETTARALDAIPLTLTLWAEWKLLAQPDDMGWGKVLLAEAQLAQGQASEALKTIESALAVYREMQVQGANHLSFRQHFARALYVQALAQPADAAGTAQRRASLAEAAKLLAELTEEARQLHDTKELLAWVEAEQTKHSPAPQP